jgi:hypothetical protein
LTGYTLANTNALVPGPHLSTSNSISRGRAPRAALVLMATLLQAMLVLAMVMHAACLPLDDLSSYSSAWQAPSAIGADGEAALDASASTGDGEDAGATPSGGDAAPDASSPPASSPDVRPGAPAPDAGEPRVIDDGGVGLDAGADAAP